ncbi:MAG: hypothetical protein ABIP79_01400 [Chitinophagaceae bacterium]
MKKKTFNTILLFVMIHLLIFHVAYKRENGEQLTKTSISNKKIQNSIFTPVYSNYQF